MCFKYLTISFIPSHVFVADESVAQKDLLSRKWTAFDQFFIDNDKKKLNFISTENDGEKMFVLRSCLILNEGMNQNQDLLIH